MDTHEEEFALMRHAFLQTALRAAEAGGGSPSSWVRLEQVAKGLGADLSGEARTVLMRRYAEMAIHYQNTEDLTDFSVSEGKFRLTERGIAAAKGEEE